MFSEFAARDVEQPPAEAKALMLGQQIQFENLAGIGHGRHAVPAKSRIADDARVEFERQ